VHAAITVIFARVRILFWFIYYTLLYPQPNAALLVSYESPRRPNSASLHVIVELGGFFESDVHFGPFDWWHDAQSWARVINVWKRR